MVTIKSRVDGQIVASDFKEGQDVKAGTLLFQIDPRPFEAALDAGAGDQAEGRGAARQRPGRSRPLRRSWSPQGYKSQQTYDQHKALVAQLQAAIKGDEAQIETARLNLGYADDPRADRRPARRPARRCRQHGARHRRRRRSSRSRSSSRSIVSFTVPQENQHKIREKQAQAAARGAGLSARTARRRSPTGKLTLIDNAIDQATGTIQLKATLRQ